MNINKPYKIFAEVLEQEAIDQFESAMRQPFVVQGALMPDAHTGYSLPIGAVVATEDVVVPAWVGYDIGCGMCAISTTYDVNDIRLNAQNIFDDIYKTIPVGFSHNKRGTFWDKWESISYTLIAKEIFSKNGLRQLGSLGGGNHFIEIGADQDNKVWIVIHSGSRGIGHAIATHYMKLASGDGKAREGHFGFNVNSIAGIDYIKDMNFCLEFALSNRLEMIKRVLFVISKFCDGIGEWNSIINRNHNHAEKKNEMWIHRKGATHADEGMMGVIPGNMRDGSFIIRGKGNADALFSSSHGAGRVLGRKKAKQTLQIDKFIDIMDGITANITQETIDESPFAYKNIFDVMKLQSEMVDIVGHISPIINIKG